MSRRRLHFVGAGGLGMSGLARLAIAEGDHVTGSDRVHSEQLTALCQAGADVRVGPHPEAAAAADAVIVSSAVPEDDRDCQAARKSGVAVMDRKAWLPHATERREVYAIAGTHGKTTTAAMLAYALQQLGADPAAVIGGVVPQLGGNALTGRGVLVIEADEYGDAFHGLTPTIGVITHVEYDHPDQFSSEDEVYESFRRFVANFGADGTLIGCGDAHGLRATLARPGPALPRVLLYGASGDAAIRVVRIRQRDDSGITFAVETDSGEPVVSLALAIGGDHNALNGLAALLVCREAGYEVEAAADAIGRFTGVARRFEIVGRRHGVTVIDDYAHHPTAVRAALKQARDEYPNRPLHAVFQPHTFSRTKYFAHDFAHALKAADRVFVTDVYGAREEPIAGVDASLIARHIPQARTGDLSEAVETVAQSAEDEPVVVLMGAGDINTIARPILTRLHSLQQPS